MFWKKSRFWVISITLVVLLSIIGLAVFYLYITHNTNTIPSYIKTKLIFSPLVIPDGTINYRVSNYKLASTEDKEQTLSYLVSTKNGTVSISQQSQPVQFVEIPEYKDRFLDNVAKQYDTVQSSSGTIYLGHLEKQNNKQLGIMLEKGLLIFLNPEKQLDTNQWRNLGDQLELYKVSN